MRNQWRLLLRHCHHRHSLSSSSAISRHLSLHQVKPTSHSSSLSLSSLSLRQTNSFQLRFPCCFSSEPTNYEVSPQQSLLIDLFAKPISNDEIKKELEANNVIISHGLILEVLKDKKLDASSAIRLFDWVLERESERLSSKSYNLMLGILGSNGYVKEFWDMVDAMKKKGYAVSSGAFVRVSEKFEKDGLESDLERLKGLFDKDPNASVERACSRIMKIVRNKVWDDDVEKEMRELGITYTSELVKMVLEKMSMEPLKGLIFFRWIEESELFKHDGPTYNAMAVVLGREECRDRFWNVMEEMKNAGHELETGTYVKVMDRFMKRRMIEDAVKLFEFAMDGENKPSARDCTFLLRKISVSQELDTELFSRVVKAFTVKGFSLNDSMLDSVIKGLTSVGRLKECNRVLDVMAEAGFRPSGGMQNRVAYDLSSSELKDEASEFMNKLEEYGSAPDNRTWTSLIEGLCVSGDLDKAKECFGKMVEKEGASSAGYALDVLITNYCKSHRAVEVVDFLSHLAEKEDVKPQHASYRRLIEQLLHQGGFEVALRLFPVMKKHGFPPFLDPFVGYLSRKGTPDEAVMFFKAVTVKRSPSTNVFLRILKAFFKAGQHSKAQDLLARCPQYIRNHADVLNLFCSNKPENPVEQAAVAA